MTRATVVVATGTPDTTGTPGTTGTTAGEVRLAWRTDGDGDWPALVWVPGGDWRMISSGVEGGGLGERSWYLNAQVGHGYARMDPRLHLGEIAGSLGLTGAGVGLLTAADVRYRTSATDGAVLAVATVGLGVPVPAAAPDAVIASETAPGTINILAVVPVPLSDAALVNAVITATEAKTQALVEAGVPGTGTSSDAVCIACPRAAGPDAAVEPFGGPRSTWGIRLARAVHRAVAEGTADWLRRHPAGGERPPWSRG
jgi:adenosylcobinamide amidohydrolase